MCDFNFLSPLEFHQLDTITGDVSISLNTQCLMCISYQRMAMSTYVLIGTACCIKRMLENHVR